MRGRALVIDGDPAIRRGVARALAEREIEPITAEDGAAGRALLRAQPADVALVDAGDDGAGLDAAHAIAREHPGIAIVLMTPPARAAEAVEAAWSIGADVLEKPIEPFALAALFAARALDRRRAEQSARAAADSAERETPVELVGVSTGVRTALRLAAEAGRTAAPVLVTGEDGSGRDRLARRVHDRSRRSARPFVSLSCAALAEDPEGARIFGVVEDGVIREGLADVADRGTLFLDAIEALPIAAQDRLLVLLARGRIARVDGDEQAVGDVRVVGGASMSLRERVRAGVFREELFYRLSALEIPLPPLRERAEDVPMLAYAFLRAIREETGRDIRRISAEALRLLRHHSWPGNARELGSVLAHAAALARKDVISPADLPFSPRIPDEAPAELFDDELAELPYVEARRRALDAFEERYTRLVIAREGGNMSGAARRAGMDRSNFKRLVRRTKEPPG
jgi:DNA-binding NtrC family response regulator